MSAGRVLGLDPGHRRVGVALSDPGGVIASPYDVIARNAGTAERIAELCAELDVTTVVVGLPVGLSGREGPAADEARSFGADVAATIGHDVVYWDERFTSVTAERSLVDAGVRRAERREVRDKVAAAVMLQAYLDHTGNDRSRSREA